MNSVCPICQNCSPRIVDRFRANRIIQKYLELSIDIGHYYKGYEYIVLMSCRNTTTRFFSPSSLAGDAIFYELLYQKLGSQLYYPEDKWEHQKALDFIVSNNLKSVLDIGAGSGVFLEKLPRDTTRHALEFSKEAIGILRSKGIGVYNQNIEEFAKIESNKEKYDVITAFQVLEHIPDIFSFINSIQVCLKPGGYFIFATPNNVPYIYGYDKYHTLNLPPHHMTLWCEESFRNLEKVFPIKMINFYVEPFNKENFFIFIRHVLSHRLGIKWGERFFYRIIFPLNRIIFLFHPIFKKRNRNILSVYRKM